MSNPACPACATRTTLAKLDVIAGFECPECGGHCIRAPQIAKFFADVGKPERFEEFLVAARSAPEAKRTLRCPDCAANDFRAVSNGLVEIDVCAGCGGAYFDRGEASLYLRQARYRVKGGAALGSAAETVDGIGGLIDFLSSFHL